MEQQSQDIKEEVRRSIVRISFDWMPKSKDRRFMVIAGIILSIKDDGSAVIAANSTFFGMRKNFAVNFPNATGYEEGQKLVAVRKRKKSAVLAAFESAEGFYIFDAKPRENGYIKAVRFETQSVQVGDPVDSFVFPREGYITPTGYCRGSVTGVCSRVLFHDCPMHEYAYLGSPLFNLSGDLVGITYLDQRHWQAWTVWQLRDTFKHWKSTFVSQGNEEPAGAEAQVEEPAGAEAQVEEPAEG
ncbi:hypothetical protein BDA96_04G006100 [Sorghum bicolor]|uniref:Uncharacterized protein n=1 Tax=Sorghum bicolor TaxID=4558 RepID=A0A921R236_SORBI|nr:uncharacterized protein LOC110434478 isoform X2 [Sorghum bicolor]KAG0531232.1 hypothetical protein BDA96_04G006100 [Sorghum bicolor]|eukprot:XP_021314251.1 uncharacterized protein LOC110434478 isoform X2 [Sorghum bicolor]